MNLLKTSGLALLCASSLGCVSIFHAMSRDFHAETGTIPHAGAYEAGTNVKVIAYNIAHCRGSYDFYGNNTGMDELDMDLTIDSPEQVYKCLDNVAEMLVRENADIALLQEVDRKAVWSYDIDFTPYLAEKAGMEYYAYGPKYDFVWWPFEYQRANGTWIDTVYFDTGNAVLSRCPIVSAENKAFQEQGFLGWIAGEERYLDTVIQINHRQARFISTHFGSGEAEARRIIEEANSRRIPLVVGGTLHLVLPDAERCPVHCEPCSADTMQGFIDSGLFNIYMEDVDPLDISYYTADTENLYWTADYIIPTREIEIKDYYVVDAELSDHMPVAAVLRLTDSQ